MSFFGPRGGRIAAESVPVMHMPVQEVRERDEVATVYDTSVIARDTIIEGNISCNSDLTVLGQVKGDVTAKGHVYICGAVEGQVSCDSMAMSSCTVEGNVTATSGVIQDADSTLVGDISSANLTAAGKIVGNVSVDNCISLKSTAVILGNLAFRDLAVEQGAVLRGEIRTNRAEVE
ncbi:MAG: polymer-forming cytoskeletal protein [Angelakisella sp.]